MSSSTYEYLITGNGSSLFADNTTGEVAAGEREGCNTPGGEGRPIQWGMLSLSLLIVATSSGNILVCLAVAWERRLQNMTNYFLMSLAIADLLVSVVVMPLAMIVELFGYFPLSPSLCVIWATMDVLLCTASIWHMCTMSMDRYFTIRYPIRYGRNKTKKMMSLKITFVWIISFAVSAPLAIAGFVDYSNVYRKGKCLPSIKNFVLYGSIFAFYVPLIIMVTTYALTIRILRQNRVLMAGLDGNSNLQVPAAGDGSHRGSHHFGGASKIGETTKMSCPGLSPPHSGFTITSVGMTSAKCSSAESALSPVREQRWFNAKYGQEPRSKVLKVNLADEANYVKCNFDQMFLKNSQINNAFGRNQTPSRSTGLQTLLPKHSNFSIVRRNSHPNISRSSKDAGDRRGPSLLFLRLSRHHSDTYLTSLLQSDYSPNVFDTSSYISDDQTINDTTRFFCPYPIKTENETALPYATFALRNHQQPIGFRLTSSNSVQDAVVHERYADFESSFRCIENGQLLKQKAPSCLTTQTTTDTSRGTSPFLVDDVGGTVPFGAPYVDTIQLERILTLSADGSRGLEDIQRNGRRLPTTDATYCEVATSDGLTRHPNGSAKVGRTVDAVSKKDDEDEPEDVRSLLVAQTQQKCQPIPTPPLPLSLMTTGSWNRCSPSVDTSPPSRTEHRTFLRSRVDQRRTPRTLPSACARKIGLLSKNRTTNERKASKVLGIIFAVFVLSWTPFFTMNIISVVCGRCIESVSDSVMASMVWLGYLSSLANPIIYTMFSTSFRTVFYRILTCQYKHAAGCGRVSRRHSPDERYLCWSKSRRGNSLKEFGCLDAKIGGV